MALETSYPALSEKIQKARQAGYSDQEIEQHVAAKVEKARAAGYSDEEISSYLGTKAQPQEPTWGETAAGSVKSGVEGMEAGIGSLYRWAGDATQAGLRKLDRAGVGNAVRAAVPGLPFYEKVAPELGKEASHYWRQEAQESAPKFVGTFMENPSWKRAAGLVAQAAPSLGAATVASVATGSPAAGAAFLSAVEGAPQYEEAREAGKGLGEASAYGAASGVATFVLEKFGLDRLLKGTGPRLVRGLKGMVSEGGTEGLQTIAQNLVEKYGYNPARSIWDGVVESIVGGAGSGAVVGSVMGEAQKAGIPPQEFDQVVTAVAETVAKEITPDSPLGEEIPGTFDPVQAGIKEGQYGEIIPEPDPTRFSNLGVAAARLRSSAGQLGEVIPQPQAVDAEMATGGNPGQLGPVIPRTLTRQNVANPEITEPPRTAYLGEEIPGTFDRVASGLDEGRFGEVIPSDQTEEDRILAEIERKTGNLSGVPEKNRTPNQKKNLVVLQQQKEEILAKRDYVDSRLKRTDYRDILAGIVWNNTEVGAKVGKKAGDAGYSIPSGNSVWIRKAINTVGSVEKLQDAVDKALSGAKVGTNTQKDLGENQAEAVRLVLDEMQRQRVEAALPESLRKLQAARDLHRLRKYKPGDALPPPAEETEMFAGENLDEQYYAPEWDAPRRDLAELIQDALSLDEDSAGRILELDVDNAELSRRLYELIGARNSGALAQGGRATEETPADAAGDRGAPADPGASLRDGGGFLSEADREVALIDRLLGVPVAPEVKSYLEEKRHKARVTDRVTGLLPNEQYQPTMDRAWAEHQKGRAFAYGVIDLANLGGLNSYFGGESAANPTVRTIAQIIQSTVKEKFPTAQVFRQGGDEFSVLLPDEAKQDLGPVLSEAKKRVQKYVGEQGLSEIEHTKQGKAGVDIYHSEIDFSAYPSFEEAEYAVDGANLLKKEEHNAGTPYAASLKKKRLEREDKANIARSQGLPLNTYFKVKSQEWAQMREGLLKSLDPAKEDHAEPQQDMGFKTRQQFGRKPGTGNRQNVGELDMAREMDEAADAAKQDDLFAGAGKTIDPATQPTGEPDMPAREKAPPSPQEEGRSVPERESATPADKAQTAAPKSAEQANPQQQALSALGPGEAFRVSVKEFEGYVFHQSGKAVTAIKADGTSRLATKYVLDRIDHFRKAGKVENIAPAVAKGEETASRGEDTAPVVGKATNEAGERTPNPGATVPKEGTDNQGGMNEGNEDAQGNAAQEGARDDARREEEVAASGETVTAPGEKAGGRYSLDAHRAFMRRLYDGEVSASELKANFAELNANAEKIQAELSSLKKDDLLKLLGPMGQHQYKSEKKDRVARAVWSSMQEDYHVGDALSFFMGGRDAALQKAVEETTDEDLKTFAEKVKASRTERKARIEGAKKALTNPETLEEFQTFIRLKSEADLTPEQRAKYDELVAEKNRSEKKEAQEKKATISAVDVDADMKLVETKHTRDGYDLFVVQLSARVSPEQYKELLQKAKRLGGWYSSFKGSGAVHGFQFKEKDQAEKFMALKEGDVSRADFLEKKEEETQGNAAERMKEVASSLREKAEASLGQDRKTHTHRMARMAEGAEASARAELALAQTLENLAGAIESGEAKHLSGIRAKTHVETLDSILERAKWEADRKDNVSYESSKGRPAAPEDVEATEYPFPSAHLSDLNKLITFLETKKGVMRMAQSLRKLAAKLKPDDTWGYLRKEGDIELLREAIKKGQDLGMEKWSLENMRERFAKYDRLQKMGIPDLPSLRAALREYLQYRGRKPAADRIKQLEREIALKPIPGFFPTPKAIVADMIERAGLEEGMRVLEPSAGKGNIADAIREAGIEPEVVEFNGELADFLQNGKKFNLVGRDFLEHTGEYDRIIMNPPFENGQEIEHVRHAYDLLKPGGKLVSIMSKGPFSRSDKKATAFREWMEEIGGISEDLPDGSFKSAERPTGVATVLVEIDKDAPALSRAPKSSGLDKAALESSLSPLFQKWKNAPKVEVVQSLKDLPKHLRDFISSTSGTGDIEGVFDPKTQGIFLVADNLTPERARFVLGHEALGHFGLRGLLGDSINGILDQVAVTKLDAMKKVAKAYGFDLKNQEDRRQAAEEVLANMAAQGQTNGYLKRLYVAIRNFLREMGFDLKLTDPEIEAIVADAARYVKDGKRGKAPTLVAALSRQDVTQSEAFKKWFGNSKVVDEDGRPLVVYHGTGKEFTEFAQTYGSEEGFFFSPYRRIAKAYGKTQMPVFLALKNPLVASAIEWAEGITPGQVVAEERGHDGYLIRGDKSISGLRTDTYVAFRPEQIKSATGNRGTFDPQNPDIRFSRKGDIEGDPDVEFIFEQAPKWNEVLSGGTKKLLNFSGRYIPERAKATAGKFASNPWFGSENNPIRRKVVNLNLKRSESRNALIFDLSKAVPERFYLGAEGMRDALGQLDKEGKQKVNRLIKDGDIKGEYYSREQMEKGETPAGKLSPLEQQAYIAFHQTISASRRAMFEKLDDLAIIPYEGTELHKKLKEVLAGKVKKEGVTDQETLAALAKVEGYSSRLQELKDEWGRVKGYAPRNRPDGEWHVNAYEVTAAGKVKVFMRPAVTRAGADSLLEKVKADPGKYLKGNHGKGKRFAFAVERNEATPEEIFQGKGSDVALEQLINRALDKAEKSGTIEQAEAVREAILQTLADEISARGFGRHRLGRVENLVEGYEDENYLATLTQHVGGMAGWLSKAEFAIRSNRAASEIPSAKPEDKVWVANYIQDALKNSTYLDQIMGSARSVATLLYLGAKVSTATLNATQNFVVGQAELAKEMKHSGVKGEATARILKAQKDAIEDALLRDSGKRKLSADEQWALDEGSRVGRTHAQYVREISGLDDTGAVKDKYQQALRFLAQKSMILFQGVETYINREPALLAAFRVYRQAGLSKEESFGKAEEFVNNVHFVVGKENLPEFVRKLGAAGRLAYTFQSYSHNYLHWLANRLAQGEYAAVGRSMLALSLLGGVMALPFGDDLDRWIRKLYGESPMQALREWIRKTSDQYTDAGEQLTDFIMYGLPSLAGINFSGSLAVRIPFLSPDDETLAERFTGVWGGLAQKAVLAADAAAKGDAYRAIENAPFTPEAVANVMRAARQLQGATTLAGKQVFDENGQPLRYNAKDAAVKALGFNPLGPSKQQRERALAFDLEAHWKERREDVLARFRVADSNEERKEALAGVREFNQELRESEAHSLVPAITTKTLTRRDKPNKRRTAFMQETE